MPDYPWLLAVVEGPSEAKREPWRAEPRGATGGKPEAHGAVCKVVARYFGDEIAKQVSFIYWKDLLADASPLRAPAPSSTDVRGRWFRKAQEAARRGRATAYGALLLLDNDRKDDEERLKQLEHGAEAMGERERSAIGVAREMLEAWLLADPHLPHPDTPLPKPPEEVWGRKSEAESNYPKHVLKRCVLGPRRWGHADALDAWEPAKARAHAPSLDTFMTEVEKLARSQGVD
jgi:hypothetical protein